MFSERRRISGGGTRRAAAQTNENGRRAVAPSERARASERGWVFPPADDPHSKRGAFERGAPGGKTKAGETAAPRLPAAPKENPRTARPEGKRPGGQRRARSPAGDVTARPLAGAAPGRASYSASAASGQATRRKRSIYESDLFTHNAIMQGLIISQNRIHCGFNRFSICLILSIALSRTHSVISVSAISRRTLMLVSSPIDPKTTTAAL